MMEFVLASSNRNKYCEFAEFFRSNEKLLKRGVGLAPPSGGRPSGGDVLESGSTYEENALIKARAWANYTGLPAIADDSGLEVRALNWMPGLHSARAAEGSDADRIDWLLSQMEKTDDRRARFVACLVITFPGHNSEGSLLSRHFVSEGICCGRIAREPSGSHGFGYDPIFVPDERDATFAALGAEEKSKISHRAIAMNGMAKMIEPVIKYLTVCGV